MADKELIYREDLIVEYDKVHIGAAGGARKLMVDAPAIDAVEVVRCKDCNYYKKGFAGEHSNYCDCHSATFDKFFCKPNDFCSCGERKSDND